MNVGGYRAILKTTSEKRLKKFFVLGISVALIMTFMFGGCSSVKPKEEVYVANNDMQHIRQRLLVDLQDTSIDPQPLLAELNDDGAFRSIAYDTDQKDTWHPAQHLLNIIELQKAAYTQGNAYYMNAELIQKINMAIRYWTAKDYVCSWNGWWNGLGTGTHIADILLFPNIGLEEAHKAWLLEKLYATSCFDEGKKRSVKQRQINSTGGNLTDVVTHSLKYAVIAEDAEKIFYLKTLMENELRPFPSRQIGAHRWDVEGIKADMSFQQHFELLYLGGYGEVFCNGMNSYLAKTQGTQFALDKKAMDFYQDFLLDGMQYAMRGVYRDMNASGRGIVRKGELIGIFKQVTDGCRILLETGENLLRKGELEQLLAQRTDTSDAGAGGHKYFWNSDYQVYNDKNYMASIRAASKRTKNSEALNGENVLGHYLGAGATLYYIKGDEYFNIPALWNWNRIPGTTTRQGHLPKGGDKTYTRMGKTAFVGGVSDGVRGMSCLDYRDNGVRAKKAWFLFESGAVCLGTDITSRKKEPVYTNINQSLQRGNVVYSQKGQRKETEAIHTTGTFDWLYQNGIGYICDAPLEVTAEKRTGDWQTISERVSTEAYSDTVFELGIPHGSQPKNTSYTYVVLMNTTPQQVEAYQKAPFLTVLSNTDDCQAVWNEKESALQAVFYKKGSLTLPNGQTMKVNGACTLLYSNNGDNAALSVGNPLQKTKSVKVFINEAEHQFDFEKGIYAGETKTVIL